MRYARYRPACLWLVAATMAVSVVLAENVDPSDDQSQFAWAENVGWINAEPSGSGGPGVEVADFELTGWMWGENIGWASLSCKNTSSCMTTEFGVRNNGSGILSGFVWAENVGWINFAPSTSGVWIDPATGDFSGQAWGENVGWITFASDSPYPYKVTTSWGCVPQPAPPSDTPDLRLDPAGTDTLLYWSSVAGGTGNDVIYGDLTTLRAGAAPFVASTMGCLAGKRTVDSLKVTNVPPPGDGYWFLVRSANCGGNGTYDAWGPSQTAPRDSAIIGSGKDCM